ncbi:hypothetical protein G9A89_000427, partial [Geosiphon pyriformis]
MKPSFNIGVKSAKSRKKRRGGVLKDNIVLSNHSWSSKTSDTTESDSIDIKEECLVEKISFDHGDGGAFIRKDSEQTSKSSRIHIKRALGKPLGKINFLDDNIDNILLDKPVVFPPPLKNLVNVSVRKSFILDINLDNIVEKSAEEKFVVVRKLFLKINGFRRASTLSKFAEIIRVMFTSELSLVQASKKAKEAKILVNSNLKKSFRHLDWAVVLKKIPIGTSTEAVHAALSGFGVMVSIKMQLVSLWQKAIVEFSKSEQTDLVTACWSILIGKDAVHALLYTLPIGITARYAVVCFESADSLNAVMEITSVLRNVNMCWFSLGFSKCAECGRLNINKSRLATIYAKCLALIAHPVAFGGVFWAKIIKPTFPDISNVEKRFAVLESSLASLASLAGQISELAKNLVWKIVMCNVKGLNNSAKQDDVIHWHKEINNMISIITETKLRGKIHSWIMNKFDNVWVFISGLDSGHLCSGVVIIMNNSLARHVLDGSVADVEDYFDTNYKAVYASVDLGANAAMFLDEFVLARKCSDLDAIWNIVYKVIIFSANSAFKKKWFKGYNGVFIKESSKLHNLEILVSKIVKTSCEVGFGRLAIEKRMKSFVVNKDHTIHNVLECLFHKVVLDYLVFDGSLILNPVEIKNKMDSIMEGWMKKRAVLKSVLDLWQCQYLPLDYVNNDAFFGVIDAINLDNLMHVIKDLPDNKAAGLSGISNELWKHCDSSVLGLLLDLLNICLVCESVPCCWKEAWVLIIPKPYEWKSILTNTRPITLIETACKILSKLLSDRILLVCGLFNVLYGDNFSSPIFAIGLVVKDALKKDHKLWLVLQDMHKAYDSRIFYNPLLCKVKRQKSLCRYCIDTKFVGSSQVVTQYILNTVSEFFRVNNISINNKKTVAIPINQRVNNTSLSISDLLILIARKKESYQYLGIYLSSESLSKPSLAKAYTNVRFFVNLVLKKAISDKQFLYLVLAILQPIVSYKTQFSFVFRNALYHPSLYGLKSFEQLQTKYKMASVLCFSNAGGVLGRLFNHRSLDFQVLGWSPIHPLCCLIRLCISLVNNFLTGVIKIFLDYDMSLDNFSVSAFRFLGETLISTILGQLYTKKDLIFDWKTFCHWKKLDPRGPAMNVCSLSAVSRLGQYLSFVNIRNVSVYTNGSLRDLGSCKMKCGAAAYFLDLNLDISAKVGGLVSSTMTELQAIALALECVSSDSSMVVYSDSQAALNTCVAESALMEQHSIINLIREKWLDVSWHKIKEHSGVIGNEHTDELAGLAANFSLALLVLVKEKFIKAGGIFRSVYHAHWEVGSGFDVIDDSLCGNVDWFPTGFISKSTTGLCFYFLKALHCHLLVAIQKHLYNKIYPSVSCLHCGKVESSNHSFVCTFDSDAHKSIFKSHLAKSHCVSELGLQLSCVLQMLSLYTIDDMLYTTVSKDFVFRDWIQKALSILGNAKI